MQWFIIRPDHGNDSHRDVLGFHIVFDMFFTVRFPRSFSYCVFIVRFVSSSSSKNGRIWLMETRSIWAAKTRRGVACQDNREGERAIRHSEDQEGGVPGL